MKVMTIVIQENEKGLKFILINEKDTLGIVSKNEQELADVIEDLFAETFPNVIRNNQNENHSCRNGR